VSSKVQKSQQGTSLKLKNGSLKCTVRTKNKLSCYQSYTPFLVCPPPLFHGILSPNSSIKRRCKLFRIHTIKQEQLLKNHAYISDKYIFFITSISIVTQSFIFDLKGYSITNCGGGGGFLYCRVCQKKTQPKFDQLYMEKIMNFIPFNLLVDLPTCLGFPKLSLL